MEAKPKTPIRKKRSTAMGGDTGKSQSPGSAGQRKKTHLLVKEAGV